MDDGEQIIRRLALLDRKLNYLGRMLSIVLGAVVASLGYYFARTAFAYYPWVGFAALVLIIIVCIVVGRKFERIFQPLDPE
jgi:hypothetical protein